jgi:hypothetical protein
LALTFNDVVDRAQTYGPEVPQATIVSFANERAGRMVAEAEFRVRDGALTATTVAAQNAYNLDADTVDVRSVRIGTDRYDRASIQDINELEAGRADLDTRDGSTGVFAPYFSSTGTAQIYLYPAPSATGDSIVVEEALHPSDSTYSGTDNMATVIPKHLRSYLVDGVVADVYDFQGRQDMAQFHEQRFEDGIDKLRRLRNTRVGSGPARIKLLR